MSEKATSSGPESSSNGVACKPTVDTKLMNWKNTGGRDGEWKEVGVALEDAKSGGRGERTCIEAGLREHRHDSNS